MYRISEKYRGTSVESQKNSIISVGLELGARAH
jgi:hypothetical protein